ncbi:uncharacterized protein PV09_06829 [Verruconis gallopava]|uniref:Very long-chain fatty acid transport protein n=1 Tax=Verruconis gallopava TaxID=253628 RepID=A0A0D2A4D1_9PEZI|nr:uncharacterized protein PV09_06829 [Verruconis gallopava]KIW01643.1 hypothetical protein PV09_06829 [Verruconis gallopava]
MPLPIFPLAAAAAGTTAVAAYLNAKYHLTHDASLILNGISTARFVAKAEAEKRLTNFHVLRDQCLKNRPNQLFVMYEGRQYTYGEFFKLVTRVGNWLMKELGIKEGEIVALDGTNSPEYLVFWWALEGIGAIPSFLNNNLTGNALLHCVKLIDSRYLLADKQDAGVVEPCIDELAQAGVKTIYYDRAFVESLMDDTPLPSDEKLKNRGFQSIAYIMYTSGSTGLPKGVTMKQGRILATGYTMAKYLKLKPTDRFYTCMPLYHGAAHGLCVAPVIHSGCTLVLGRKFSHKRFWPEVRESKANIIQYVGELCRYLVNAPPSPDDKNHSVYMAWGNGMRPDVWRVFRERFGIPVINELYAATDGMGSALNWNEGPFTEFAIAKRGALWNLLMGKNEVRVKIDPETEDILRDENGWVVPVGTNEPGEVIHRIVDPSAPRDGWNGYWKNTGAENKRYLRDAFKKGDMWFRSGDMHRMDEDGRVYFVDRLGDTFRWKSENVSTNEVSDVLGSHPQIAEANVYGVAVPKADGRCGMAAIVLAEGVTLEQFDRKSVAQHVLSALPRYAVPYFIRVTPQLDYTGTLKMQKGRLKREGIDPKVIAETGDTLYWLPIDGKEYVPFTEKDYEALKSGSVRL